MYKLVFTLSETFAWRLHEAMFTPTAGCRARAHTSASGQPGPVHGRRQPSGVPVAPSSASVMKPACMADRHESELKHTTRSCTTSRSLTSCFALSDVARNAAPHDFVTLSCLLKAFSLQPELKILAILPMVKGLAPQASVWCGGECPHAYPLKSLTGGSYGFY